LQRQSSRKARGLRSIVKGGKVFVLMPFSKNFDDVYKFGIKAACNNIGVQCERMDEQLFQEYVRPNIRANSVC
jgi:hypothetical protein